MQKLTGPEKVDSSAVGAKMLDNSRQRLVVVVGAPDHLI
jgi:hypothetical protein